MEKIYSNLMLVGIVSHLFVASPLLALAEERVVVIPLGGGSKNYMYWQGEWTDSTSYKVGDGVQKDGSSYMCIVAHASNDLANSPPNPSFWDVIAAAGICSHNKKIVFVTRATYTGSLGGAAGANSKCQDSARTANLYGKFSAWISGDPGTRPVFRAPNTYFTNGTYVLPSGTIYQMSIT